MSDQDQNWLIGDLSFEYDGHVVPAGARPGRLRARRATAAAATRRPSGPSRPGSRRSASTAGPTTARARHWSCSHATCRRPRALLQEGWARRGPGEAVPPGGRLPDRGDVRDRLVRAARRGDLRRSGCRFPPCSRPGAAARDISCRWATAVGPVAGGVAEEVRDPGRGGHAGGGSPSVPADASRPARRPAGRAARARFDERFERARAAAPVPGHARGPAGRVPGSAPAL